MIGYALTVLGILGATLVPVYIALYLVTNLRAIPTRYLAAAGVGLVFWFFFDTLGNAAQLDVNQSFTGGSSHVGVVIAFVAGVSVLGLFDHFAVPRPTEEVNASASARGSNSKALFLSPLGVAAVMGIHGLAEGWDFGSAAAVVSGNTLADAFGGLSPLVSYPIHKFLEASIIAIVYLAFVGRGNATAKWHLPVLGLLFGFTPVVGASIGYYISQDTTFFYAFGVTAALYSALRLVEATHPRFKIGDGNPSYLGGKIFVALVIGFFLLYGAALLH